MPARPGTLSWSVKVVYIGRVGGTMNETKPKTKIAVAIALILSASIALVGAEEKTALLIANAKYANFGSLATPIKEARELRDTLKSIGFQVTLVENGSRESMMEAISDFEDSLKKRGGVAFFHYGGHGVQVAGKNYLIPSDAEIPDERRVETRAVSVDEIMSALDAARTGTNIVVLDACRNNPLPAQSGRSASRGLSTVSFKPKNSIIVYSAEAGSVAQDGLFTPTLCAALRQKGKSFQEILMEVRRAVSEKSDGEQIPGEYNQTFESIYFNGLPEKSAPAVAAGTAPVGSTVPAGASVARPSEPSPDTYAYVAGGLTPLCFAEQWVTVGDFWIGKTEVTQAQYEAVMGENPSVAIGADLPVDSISWYGAILYCNELSRAEGLEPAYKVDKLHKDPNNVSEYDDKKWTVTWNKAANGYRLPTHAEWEYAARGGQKRLNRQYSGGESLADVGWFFGNSGDKPQKDEAFAEDVLKANKNRAHPVAKKAPNELGLFDMSGNLSEWCWDWYSADPLKDSATDPTGPTSGSGRVNRGGTWAAVSWESDLSAVGSISPHGYLPTTGFRVARSAN